MMRPEKVALGCVNETPAQLADLTSLSAILSRISDRVKVVEIGVPVVPLVLNVCLNIFRDRSLRVLTDFKIVTPVLGSENECKEFASPYGGDAV